MTQASLGASHAWKWIVDGWRVFLKNPLMWVLLALIYVVGLFILNQIPVFGAFLAALLTPALIAGLLFGVHELEHGRVLLPAHLFRAFQDTPKLIQLLLLGIIPMVVTLLQKALLAMPIPQSLAVLLGLLLTLAAASTLLYALPLVLFGGQQALDAAPASLRACFNQPVAVGVFLGLGLLLAIIAMIPLGLGLLVYLPVMVAAMHASYKQVI